MNECLHCGTSYYVCACYKPPKGAMDDNQKSYYLTLETDQARHLFIAFCQQLQEVEGNK